MSIINWLLHGLTHCPKTELTHTMYGTTHCRSCGRVEFVSDTLPKITRFQVNKRLQNL